MPAKPGSLEEHIQTHQPAAVRERLQQAPRHSYLRDFVYGAIDGIVTTFAIVSGVAGAGLDTSIVIVLGMANLVGDGFSMAAGNFLGTRAERQMRQHIRRTEESHIHQYPEGEKEEIREIYRKKGFSNEDLDRVVEVITADRQQWIDTMLTEEFGLALNSPVPMRAALTTFIAFGLVGLLPLLPFIAQYLLPESVGDPFLWSTVVTSCAFFGVGAAKARFVRHKWFSGGFETLLVGGVAAGLAYSIGILLAGLVGG